MMGFDPPPSLGIAFTVLTLALVAAEVGLVRVVAPPEHRNRWAAIATGCAVAWLVLHAALAESGLLVGDSMPPPVAPYLLGTMAVAVYVAASPLGARLATLPLAILVGLMTYRLPLEVLLHLLYESGDLPVQMTWSGSNFDVITGVLGLALGLLGLRGPLSPGLVLGFNVLGLALLFNVVTIALLSAPLPFRQFMNDPPVVLVFHAPYNWIVNVHVWTALVGHLVLFRALARRRIS